MKTEANFPPPEFVKKHPEVKQVVGEIAQRNFIKNTELRNTLESLMGKVDIQA